MRKFITGVLLSLGLSVVQAAGAAAEPAATSLEAPRQVMVMLHVPRAHFRADANYAGGYADAAGRAARRRVAAALARANGLDLATEWPMPALRLDCFVMDVPARFQAEDVAAQLALDPRVAWAQPMNLFTALGHDDPLFPVQPAASEWRLDELHILSVGRGVRVAVVDSGVQTDHPDLASQVAESANLIDGRQDVAELHGTAVAGVIAAQADNHVGIVGVAPQVRLLALRACAESTPVDTRCTTLSLALALQRALERDAQVINLSLGGPSDRLIRTLIEVALARGVGIVAAARRSEARGGFPADLPGVVGVIDAVDGAAPSGVVAAPGTDVLTTLPHSRWGMVSGSSYAAAHVSGLLALMIDMRMRRGGGSASLADELVVRADRRIDACASVLRAGGAGASPCGATPPVVSAARR